MTEKPEGVTFTWLDPPPGSNLPEPPPIGTVVTGIVPAMWPSERIKAVWGYGAFGAGPGWLHGDMLGYIPFDQMTDVVLEP